MSATKQVSSLASRFRITRVYLLTGLWFLGASWFCMLQSAEALSLGRWLDPFLLAAVHLFVIGYAMIVVQGAMLQIVPVAFQGRLYSIRLGYVQYAMMVLGAVALPAGFLAKQWNAVAAGGIFVLLSTLLLLWNLGQTLRTLKKRTEARVVMTAFLFFFIAVLLGVAMSLGRFPSGGKTLSLHMVSGITGWFTTLIILLSPRLMGFFVSSRYKGLRRNGPGILVLVGMAAVLLGRALQGDGGMTAVATGVATAGWILYLIGYLQVLIDLYRHFRDRRRQEVEWVLKWILGGLYGGWPVVVAWALASGSPDSRWAVSGVLLSLFGFLQWNIAAYMAKILPFLRWMGRYGHGVAKDSTGRLPGVHEMMPRGPTVAALSGFAAGAVFLTLGTGFGQGSLTTLGSVLGTVAWAQYALAMVIMYRR